MEKWQSSLEDVGIKVPLNKEYASVDPSFWKGKKVFLTGHTGFKGSWISLWLTSMGAKVIGFSLAPNTSPSLFDVARVELLLEYSRIADIRDLAALQEAMTQAQPEIVIHMAAQPLVRYSYRNPVVTYATNVMGTVHVLEAVRTLDSARAVVVVTSDKCYENCDSIWGYRENDPMGGYDPYSNSKGCAELVISAYRQSYFSPDQYDKHGVAIASARAGNVIGGGDWSVDRLIPDAIKAFEAQKPLVIRNPLATRPWQHVLEPLSGYLVLAQSLYQGGKTYNGAWNFGPKDEDTRSVKEVVNLLIRKWQQKASWRLDDGEKPHEAHSLKLDCSKAHQYLKWMPTLNLEQAIDYTVQWQLAYQSCSDMQLFSLQQIYSYQQI